MNVNNPDGRKLASELIELARNAVYKRRSFVRRTLYKIVRCLNDKQLYRQTLWLSRQGSEYDRMLEMLQWLDGLISTDSGWELLNKEVPTRGREILMKELGDKRTGNVGL